MCYPAGSPEAARHGYTRCPACATQSNYVRLTRKTARAYRSDLADLVERTTGDVTLARRVRGASMSAMPALTAALGADPAAVSERAEMPTGGEKNHAVPDRDAELARDLAASDKGPLPVAKEPGDMSPEEVVALVSDPAFRAESDLRRAQWKAAQENQAAVEAAAGPILTEGGALAEGDYVVPKVADDEAYSGASGAAAFDPATGTVIWSPSGTLDTPDEQLAAAEVLLHAASEANGEPGPSGKVSRATLTRVSGLMEGDIAADKLKNRDISESEARDVATRLRALADADEDALGEKPTKKALKEVADLRKAADDVDAAADAVTYAPVGVSDIYSDPDALGSLYDTSLSSLTKNDELTPEQARHAAAAFVLNATNQAADDRQNASLDAYAARMHYESEEDRMAARLREAIPSGNANSDHKSMALGDAELLTITEEGSAEWLNARNTGIGGSEILSAMGLKDYVKANGTLSEMSDKDQSYWMADALVKKSHTAAEDEADRSTTGAAARGHAWEPVLRAQYALEHPEVDVACGKQTWKGRDGEESYQTLNVDGIIRNPKTHRPEGLLECKNSDVSEKWDDGVPVGYRAQVLSYLDATNLEYADLVARVDGENRTYRISKNDPVSGVEGTPTFADYKPRVEAAWSTLRSHQPTMQKLESDALAAGATPEEAKGVMAAANPLAVSRRRDIEDTSYALSTAAKNMEGLGLGSREALASEISARRELGEDGKPLPGSTDRAVRAIVAERFDRKKMGRVVGVDGETASAVAYDPSFNDPRAFSPMYSDWIETGVVYQDADGTKHGKESILHGADQRILDLNGTGAEDVHHISPEMIAGKPRLADPETRKRVHTALADGDVIVAHNVNFEQKHLFHHLPALKSSSKWLDTAWLTRHFMPEEVGGKARGGSLKDFTEDNGGQYRNAHRAAEDAEMMVDAMGAFFERENWAHRGA